MSITESLSAADTSTTKQYKKSFHHRRNDSDELDVFEAARYFSGYNEGAGGYYSNAQKIMRDDHKQYSWRGGRMSLDVPMMNPALVLPQQQQQQQQQQSHHGMEKQMMMKDKKYKQPSSPGGRLASFLNSLFNQTSSKKKKSKSTTQSMKDEDESPGGRRKRRSSISHFRSSSTTDTKSLYSSSSSGFRTPPPYTPTKGYYKDFRGYADHKYGNSLKSQNVQVLVMDNDKRNPELSWLDEKYRSSNAALISSSDKPKNNNNVSINHRYLEKDSTWVDRYPSGKEFRKFNETEDGAESDSSSDLFELQNYDLGIYSSGLPVYETTHMDSIKRGAPISNATM